MSVVAMLVQYQREVNRIFRICVGRVGRSGPEWCNANLNKNALVVGFCSWVGDTDMPTNPLLLHDTNRVGVLPVSVAFGSRLRNRR